MAPDGVRHVLGSPFLTRAKQPLGGRVHLSKKDSAGANIPDAPGTEKTAEADSRPAYVRAQDAILEMIESAEYFPGDRIPSERVLTERFGISRMTTRKAIENLVRAGYLERRSTSGTHVALPSVTRPLNVKNARSLSEIVKESGAVPGSRLLFFETAEANKKLAKFMEIGEGEPLIVIRRLRTANGIPFCVETSYLPTARVPGLIAADFMENISLYDVLTSRYQIHVGERDSFLSVVPIGAKDAELLGMSPGNEALVHRSRVLDQDGKPIEYLISVNHPRKVIFATRPSIIPPDIE
jgi:GntR family transcriptional regulator